MSYAKGKNFNVVFLPLRYSAGDTYRGSGLVTNETGSCKTTVQFGQKVHGWTLHMIMCVLLCYPVSIRIYYQQGGLFLVTSYSKVPSMEPGYRTELPQVYLVTENS